MGDFISEKEWYDSEESIKNLINNFEKAGLPLEYRAKKIFSSCGFEANESYYKDPSFLEDNASNFSENPLWRQIDLIVYPDGVSYDFDVKVGNTKIDINISFTAECKYSSDRSFFTVSANSNFLHDFPVTSVGAYFFPNYVHMDLNDDEESNINPIISVNELFAFDIFENIVEAKVEKPGSKKEDNYNDKITYGACEQLFTATTYEKKLYLSDCDDIRFDILESNLFKKWMTYLAEKRIKKNDLFPKFDSQK